MDLNESVKLLARNLEKILDENKNKRVIVAGTTCTGKSTFLKYINNAYDMDELVFLTLSKNEEEYVCQTPWTEKIGKTMNKLVKERVKVNCGQPVFGTVILDCDLIIYLRISDRLLKKRTILRNHSYYDAKNMQRYIEKEIKNSGIKRIEFNIE